MKMRFVSCPSHKIFGEKQLIYLFQIMIFKYVKFETIAWKLYRFSITASFEFESKILLHIIVIIHLKQYFVSTLPTQNHISSFNFVYPKPYFVSTSSIPNHISFVSTFLQKKKKKKKKMVLYHHDDYFVGTIFSSSENLYGLSWEENLELFWTFISYSVQSKQIFWVCFLGKKY